MHRKIRIIFLNLVVIFTIAAIFETVFVIREMRHREAQSSMVLENVYVAEPDDYLGWKLYKNTSRVSRKYVGGNLIYEAMISVDSNGLRISPPCLDPCTGAVLFFGNSCTYGEGVHDSLTLPWQFSIMTGQVFQVYNFGMYGYGPHQMFSQINQGIVESIVTEKVKHVVFQTLYPEQAYRSSGYFDWNINCPKYTLDKNKEPVFSGNYKKPRPYFRTLSGILAKSAALRHLSSRQPKNPLTPEEKELYATLILRSKNYMDEKFNNPVFHMVLWDWSDGSDTELFEKLKQEGIRIHDARDIFPENPASLEYRINKYDTHPSAIGYRFIAEYIAKEIGAATEK